MRKFLLLISVVLVSSTMLFGQSLQDIGNNNPTGFDPGNTEAPWFSDQGARSVWFAGDMDQDGKPELIATDYSNGGRVHVFELASTNTLELVWSSPLNGEDNPNSTPRWVQTGDMDGDGLMEIVFPTGARYAGQLNVYEWDGSTDNGYGDAPLLTLTSAQDTVILGSDVYYRMDRERGTMYDFDGDGNDELVTVLSNSNVVVLGVDGDIGGFGSWQIEAGDPVNYPDNRFSGGSHWHSIPVDYDGDGNKEIVNHYWNFYGFWSISAAGGTYTYPDPANMSNYYYEYLNAVNRDAVAYMGLSACDVDGDGTEEIAGVLYGAGADSSYSLSLVSLTSDDTGIDVWDNDPVQFAIIADDLWTLADNETGSHWGMDSYDLDGNGYEEILVGGSAGYNVTKVEYKGSGDVLDMGSYNTEIVFEGAELQFFFVDYYDSAGVVDTVYRESPFVSKVYAGADMDGDGNMEVLTTYQSVADSITYTYYTYQDSSLSFEKDSTVKNESDQAVNIRVLEWTGPNGLSDGGYAFVTPDDYKLDQNYPNPFNPTTTINFTLPVDKRISLKVYDILGNEVKTLINNEEMAEGTHQAAWNGTNNAGVKVASGTYIYTLKFGNFQKSAKMTLLK
ncbi:MAG: hypothetical protein SCALA702_16420 [Melioribacteraceae bacterium]|nr:MAG: hypothetical protein SCALA702_16420 [Melioribacteraceae bacterium]